MIRWLAPREPLPIEVVAAFLRLGTKYEMKALRAEAVKVLYSYCPADLTAFDNVLKMETFSRSSAPIKPVDWIFLDMANLARECNLLSLLPETFFQCCRLWHHIERGHTRADGTISTLTPVNERACFLAYPKLLKLKEETTYAWALSPPSSFRCRTPRRCTSVRNKLAAEIFHPTSVSGALIAWKDKWSIKQCNDCIVVAKRLHNEGRQAFWEALPGIFGLPDWEKLRKERIASVIWCVMIDKSIWVVFRTYCTFQ